MNLDGSAGAQLRTRKKKRDERKRYQYSMHVKTCQNNFKINMTVQLRVLTAEDLG